MCHFSVFPCCWTFCIKSRLPLFERVQLICVLIAHLSLIYLPGKNRQTDKIAPLPENQHKYTRTFEMPKDSRTHRLLDNSLQATITPQSISPTPSLSVSLRLSPQPLCLFASLPSSQESSHSSTPIVSAPATQAESRLIWSPVIGCGNQGTCYLSQRHCITPAKTVGWSKEHCFHSYLCHLFFPEDRTDYNTVCLCVERMMGYRWGIKPQVISIKSLSYQPTNCRIYSVDYSRQLHTKCLVIIYW